MLRISQRNVVVAIVALTLATMNPQLLVAGGPLLVDPQTGTPYSWQVPPEGPPDAFYNIEIGALNSFVDNATARTFAIEGFLAWENLQTAAITYADAGLLQDCSQAPVPNCAPGGPLDVDSSNFFQVYGVLDGQSPIIFDSDGSIFSLLGLPPGVLAFASPEIGTDGFPYAIVEGIAVFNGVALSNDTELIRAVMVHEFGHFSNLAHSVVNGQAIFFGDQSGPSPNDPFGFGTPPLASIETMYPFLAVETGVAAQTPHRDDVAILSTIYPVAGVPGPQGTITGRILRSDGSQGISGVNVIARNVNDPFNDAVSALSGDFTQGAGPLGLSDGSYALRGLEGGSYAVYIDEIMEGGFSTPPALGFEEECYNGAEESSDPDLDDPAACSLVSTGSTVLGIDVILQALPPDPNEPNNEPASASPVVCGESLQDPTIDPIGDLDFYAIDLQAGEELVVDIDAADLGSPLDSLVGVFAPDGVTLLAVNDDMAPFFLDSLLTFTAPDAGRYFVAVSSWDDFDLDGSSDSGSVTLTTGFYHIHFRCTPAPVPLDFETGWLMVNQNWQTVSLERQFADPVVIASPAAEVDGDEVLVRLRNVSSGSFEIRLQEWEFQDGNHLQERVNYLVVERGRFLLPNGSEVQAGSLTTDSTGVSSFQAVNFSPSFPVAPVVLTSVGSNNDPSPVTTRLRGVLNTRFEVTLQEEEAADQVHGAETIFFLAWQAGRGSTSASLAGSPLVQTLDYDVSTAAVAHNFKRIPRSSLEIRVQEERSADAEVGHLEETVGYLILGRYGATPVLFASMQTTKGIDPSALRWRQVPLPFETGTVAVNHIWKTVGLKGSYSNPVVIAQSPSYYGATPGVIRLQNLGSNSFQIRFQEWLYLDGLHTVEEVTYLVVEAGLWTLPDGSQLQAGFLDTNQTGVSDFLTLPFLNRFPTAPVVLSSVNSYFGTQTVTTRLRSVGAESFQVTMQEEEALDQVHLSERIAFAAWEPGAGLVGNTSYLVSKIPGVTHEFTAVPASRFEVKIDEEQSLDQETDHGAESVGYLLLNEDLLTGMQTTNDPDPGNLRWRTPLPGLEAGRLAVDHNWKTVFLEDEYADPVIVARPASHNDSEPGVLRLRNVTANSFEIRFQEWLYLDDDHAPEEVAFLVMEAGRFFLPSGLQVEAGHVDTSNTGVNSFSRISFFSAFPGAPAVLSSIMTVNGGQTVTTRIHDVTNSGFLLTMQEEEANDQIHAVERIGFIAWQPGAGDFANRTLEASTDSSANGMFSPLAFTQTYGSSPCLLADMQTAAGPDPANLRYRNLSSFGVELQVDEESSADAETEHLSETIGYLAIECTSVEPNASEDGLLVVSVEPDSGGTLSDSPQGATDSSMAIRWDAPVRTSVRPAQCESDSLVFPWSLAEARWDWGELAITAVVINPHSVPVEMEIKGLNRAGTAEILERRLIQPREVQTVTTRDLARTDDLSVLLIGGDRLLDGFTLFGLGSLGTGETFGRETLTGTSARLPQGREMVFPIADGQDLEDVLLFLFNPGDVPAAATLELVNREGHITDQTTRELPPRGSSASSLSGVFEVYGGREPSYVRVRSDSVLNGIQLGSDKRSTLWAAEPAHRLPDDAVVLPVLSSGGDPARIAVHLINSGEVAARIRIQRWDSGSLPTAEDVTTIQPDAMVRLAVRLLADRPASRVSNTVSYLRAQIEEPQSLEDSSILLQTALYSGNELVGWLPLRRQSEQVLLAPIPARSPEVPVLIELPGDGGSGSLITVDLFEGGGLRVGRAELEASPSGESYEFRLSTSFHRTPGFVRITSAGAELSGGMLYWGRGILPMAPSAQGCDSSVPNRRTNPQSP